MEWHMEYKMNYDWKGLPAIVENGLLASVSCSFARPGNDVGGFAARFLGGEKCTSPGTAGSNASHGPK